MRLAIPAATAILLTLAAAVSFARAAEITAGNLAITNGWARATPPGADVGAAFVTIENHGVADDRLVRAETSAAEAATLHRSVEENGVVAMRPLEAALVPAGGRLEMRPGDTHIMLTGLSGPLREGDSIPLTLVFEAAGTVTVPLLVAPIGADAPQEGQHHQHSM